MAEREQVIAELLYLKHDCLEGSATDQTLDKAIALLKAQEPRVLTLEEAIEAKECWFESINGAYGYCDIYPFNENIVEIYRLRNPTEGIDIDGYGKIWRCWSSRPTDEQRKAVKWDD